MSGRWTVKRCPFPNSLAVDVDFSAMKFDKLLDDSQSDPKSAMTPSRRRVPLLKAIEDKGQEFRRDALSRIDDADFDVRDAAFEEHGNSPFFGVNLTALFRRFQKTCCRRSGSPENFSGRGSTT